MMAVDIDTSRCTGCGLCIAVCPSEVLELQQDKAVCTARQCLECGHCFAVCPVKAIHVENGGDWSRGFASFTVPEEWIPFGGCSVSDMVQTMRSRRSCRSYTEQPVPEDMLEDLVRIGITAPSGTNSQKWTFTVLPTRADVMDLGQSIGAFFKRLNRLARRWYVRTGLKLMGKPELDRYYRRHYGSVQRAIREWETQGRDILFHGATAVIVVGSAPGGSCPAEDALLATQNILLGAHCLGLGTCLIGYAVEAMRRDASILESLGIPGEEEVHAAIALGYPSLEFRRLTARKKPLVRFVRRGS